MNLQELRQMPHTSVSQIKTFITCPRKWAYRYVERVRPAFRPVALAMGTAWHQSIGLALSNHAEGKKTENGELHDHLRDGIVRGLGSSDVPVLFDDDEDQGALVDRAIKMLDVFLAEVAMPEVVLGVEVPFSMDISDRNGGDCPPPLIGSIDAIVMDDGQVSIWEVKTSTRRWSQDQLDFDLQLSAYKMAAVHLGHADADLRLETISKNR